MMNFKCILGLHNYKTVGFQKVQNVVGGFSMSPLMRQVNKCEKCHKINFFGYDIATNAHLDETLNWIPKLDY